MSPKRVCSMLACIAIALGCNGFVGTAFAAGPPPANDSISSATVVSALPFTDTVDTTGATTDANDVQANSSCGAPATNNSVWYKFTAGAGDTQLAVDTTGSTFSSGVLIATGTPGAPTTIACSPVTSRAPTTSGTTYYVMIFADIGTGGTLHLSVHGPGPVPANDKSGHAIPIAPLPFKTTLDTSGATTDFVDTQANQSCGAPSTGNSVWYKITPGLKHNLFLDASRSDYEVGVLVATAEEGSLTTVACGPIFAIATLKPHTTYYIMVFDAFGGGGGTLRLNIGEAPTAKVHVQKYARIDAHGVVHLRGTYSCTHASNMRISGDLVEIVGDKVSERTFSTLGVPSTNCNGGPHLWTGLVLPSGSNKFVPGKAAVFAEGSACGRILCLFVSATSVVQLTAKPVGSTAVGVPVAPPRAVSPLARRAQLRGHAAYRRCDLGSLANQTSRPSGPLLFPGGPRVTLR